MLFCFVKGVYCFFQSLLLFGMFVNTCKMKDGLFFSVKQASGNISTASITCGLTRGGKSVHASKEVSFVYTKWMSWVNWYKWLNFLNSVSRFFVIILILGCVVQNVFVVFQNPRFFHELKCLYLSFHLFFYLFTSDSINAATSDVNVTFTSGNCARFR